MQLEDNIDSELEEEFLLEEEHENSFSAEAFIQDIQTLAKGYTNRFFQTQEMYCGGKIPNSFLLTKENISTVMNMDLEKGVQRAYEAIKNDGRYKTDAVESLVPDDVKLVISIIKKSAEMGVPQRFIPGIILLYLEYCEGMSFEF